MYKLLIYLVDWHPDTNASTLIGKCEGTVDKFETRLRAQGKVKNGRGRLGLKRDGRVVAKAEAPNGQKERKPHGGCRTIVEINN